MKLYHIFRCVLPYYLRKTLIKTNLVKILFFSISVRFYSSNTFFIRFSMIILQYSRCFYHPRVTMHPISASATRLLPAEASRLVGSSGLEPPTSRLSGARSNHLSYEPIVFRCISSYLSPILFASPLGFVRFLIACHRVMTFDLNVRHSRFGRRHCRLVEMMGFEPMTPCLQGRCSPN